MTTKTLEKARPLTHEKGPLPEVWAQLGIVLGPEARPEGHTRKATRLLGQVIGLFMGSRFTTPILQVFEHHALVTAQLPTS
jgi:hypothetical protein